MKRKITTLLLSSALSLSATEKAIDLKANDSFNLAPANAVKLDGFLGRALDASYSGVKSKDVDMLVFPFKSRKEQNVWKSEFWGKWFTSAVLAYDYKPSPDFDKILKYAVSELIKTQDKQGAIKTVCPEYEFRLMPDVNNFKDMTWDVWGRKYVLLGLMAEYQRTGDKKVLDAAKKHTDYIIERIGTGEGKKDICNIGMWFGVASSSILEPIALLYQYSGEQRYLDFANYIIEAQHKSPYGKDFFRKMRDGWVITDVFHKAGDPKYWNYKAGGSKAYETMSCFEGLLEVYRITGNSDYRLAAENLAKSVRDTETIITGSSAIAEKWRRSKNAQHTDTQEWQETCVSATWLKFCAQLLRITGNPDYAGDIELTSYNAITAAQKSDGSWWCHHNPINGTRIAARPQCLKGTGFWKDRTPKLPNEPEFIMNCCVASGPRGLFVIPKVAFMTSKDGAIINLYENSSAVLPINNQNIKFNVSGLKWGVNDSAKIKLSVGEPSEFTLKLFIPQWSKNTKVYLNGKIFDCKANVAKAVDSKRVHRFFKRTQINAGKYLDISRLWKNGDTVEVKFDTNVVLDSIPAQKDILYLKYGPFVLSMDKRFEPNFDKPADIDDDGGIVSGAKFVKLADAQVAFDVPLKDGSVRRFVNYSDAGKTWSEQSSFRTIFMRNSDIKYVLVGNLYKGE